MVALPLLGRGPAEFVARGSLPPDLFAVSRVSFGLGLGDLAVALAMADALRLLAFVVLLHDPVVLAGALPLSSAEPARACLAGELSRAAPSAEPAWASPAAELARAAPSAEPARARVLRRASGLVS